MTAYTEFTVRLEEVLQRLLVTDKYDSVHNFISLYEAYENSNKPLYDVYRTYTPPIRAYKHTCVGLGFELIRRWRCLVPNYPNLAKSVALLSCEEGVKRIGTYVRCAPGPYALSGAEKEHVVVGISIMLEGRAGMLISDPGYHVPRIITVMEDGGYPSTGWFKQCLEADESNEYFYRYSKVNRNYLEWHTLVNRSLTTKHKMAVIYHKRPFYEAINVTERRNLVYNNRSLIRRDQKGRMMAGIYFKILPSYKDTSLTIFHFQGGKRKKTTVKFSVFDDPKTADASLMEYMRRISRCMRYTSGKLLRLVGKLRRALSNESFTSQLLDINQDILVLSQAQRQHGPSDAIPRPLRPIPPAAAEEPASTTE